MGHRLFRSTEKVSSRLRCLRSKGVASALFDKHERRQLEHTVISIQEANTVGWRSECAHRPLQLFHFLRALQLPYFAIMFLFSFFWISCVCLKHFNTSAFTPGYTETIEVSSISFVPRSIWEHLLRKHQPKERLLTGGTDGVEDPNLGLESPRKISVPKVCVPASAPSRTSASTGRSAAATP